VIINEATALKKDDLRQLMNRMGRTESAEMIFTFNPVDAHHWLVEDYVMPFLNGALPKDVAVHHSTYHDNPFLNPEWCVWLEAMTQTDKNFYRVYCLGEPGVLENLIYSNYVIEEMNQWPLAVRESPPHFYGQDYGTVNSMAMVAGWLYEGEYYLRELLYRTGMTGTDLIAWMQAERIPRGAPIIGDSARPDLIEDMVREGWNVLPCEKGPGSVKAGIDYLKGHKLHISTDSVNLIKEIRAYKWRERDGHPIEEPVEFFNHLMDGIRYPIFTLRPKTYATTNSAISIEQSVGGTRAYNPFNQGRTSLWGRR
jgi:phage terminase large subunit